MRAAGRPQAGFTLLEVMVVLVIIAVVASLATLSISVGDRTEVARTEASRLAALMELAGEEAVLNGENLGVGFTRTGYGFYRLQGDQWMAMAEDAMLRTRELPAGLELVLDHKLSGDVEEGAPVQVLLLASGEQTAFSVDLEEEGHPLYRLSGNEVGELTLETVQ